VMFLDRRLDAVERNRTGNQQAHDRSS
jgi:hypothetical protein